MKRLRLRLFISSSLSLPSASHFLDRLLILFHNSYARYNKPLNSCLFQCRRHSASRASVSGQWRAHAQDEAETAREARNGRTRKKRASRSFAVVPLACRSLVARLSAVALERCWRRPANARFFFTKIASGQWRSYSWTHDDHQAVALVLMSLMSCAG